MAYAICKRCHKMFEQNQQTYCKTCFEKNTKDYKLILEYITKYPEATVLEIVTVTGVALKSIDCLIDDGSLSEKLIRKT